jgi:hypothetical protein
MQNIQFTIELIRYSVYIKKEKQFKKLNPKNRGQARGWNRC